MSHFPNLLNMLVSLLPHFLPLLSLETMQCLLNSEVLCCFSGVMLSKRSSFCSSKILTRAYAMPISAKQENAVFLLKKQSSISYNIVSYFGVFAKRIREHFVKILMLNRGLKKLCCGFQLPDTFQVT